MTFPPRGHLGARENRRVLEKTTVDPIWISPPSGSSSTAMDRRVVVLPQPLGPSKVRSFPVSTSKETLSTAATDAPRSASNCFLSPVTRSIFNTLQRRDSPFYPALK